MAAHRESQSKHILITGGAGFMGANFAARLLANTDDRVTLFDNLSHPGAELNLQWLRTQTHAKRLRFVHGDVCSATRVAHAARDADEIYHFAARSRAAVESRADFDVNVTGTLNVLEAARNCGRRPMVFYLSTSKVYRALGSDALELQGERLQPADPAFRGISERAPVCFASPHICSKGAADRMVQDYAHFYDLPTVVLRADTVAGPRQFGSAGHGWIAHLMYSVLASDPIRVYGSGLQVCEVLHVSDVVSALIAARDFRAITAGAVFNIGGGLAHTISVNEMIALIERVCHRSAEVRHAPARPADRLYYMADSSAFMTATGWLPRRSVEQTVRDIAAFWHANRAHAGDAPLVAAAESGYRRAA